ncbi:phage tail family protein [Brevibacillus agri]|uniref:phage tail family protein n=1 Tax=Brevibacillus agri TaxID=51101 RepID=UPI0028681B0B|nr:phage tail family protein [Brevibacillus agri]
MRKLTFTNARGESVTLGNSAPFLVTKLEGTGAVDADLQMQKSPFQDGRTYIDSLLDTRTVAIEGAILTHDPLERTKWRRKLVQVFNPKLGPGSLKYEYDGGVKEIKAIAEGSPILPDRQNSPFQKFLITFVCPEPFWLDEKVTTHEMADFVGGLQFPLRLGSRFSIRGSKLTFQNTGDVDTPIEVQFKGSCIGPKITNLTTGEFIKVNKPLLAGETLVITTAFGSKRVEIVKGDGTRENAFNWIDLESTFWQMIPGSNTISYSTDDGANNVTVCLKWKNRFLGV